MAVERESIYTPPFRVSFPNVFRPTSYNGGDPKYTVVGLFYPAKFSEAHKKAWANVARIANEASMDKFKKLVKDLPDNYRKPVRKGEEKDLDGFGAGCVFFTMSSKQAPGVIDRNHNPVLEADFYAGCWARASVTAYAYDNKGKGVAFGLSNLQKLGEGEPFSGKKAAVDDFGDNVNDIFPDTGASSAGDVDDNDPMA